MLIVPVPLNKVRLRQRGYNQVELITSALARSSKTPHGNSTITRVRNTRSQVGINPAARYVNMQQTFNVDTRIVANRNVLLVDDLLTSGATMIACAEALFAGGAESVFALAITRA